MDVTINLGDEQLQAIAERVAALLPTPETVPFERLLTVDELAEHLNVAPDWVRRHQAELGAFRLTDGGGRNPIRFRVGDVERFLAARRLTPPAKASGSWRDDPDWAVQ
jgi:hypothetical protein